MLLKLGASPDLSLGPGYGVTLRYRDAHTAKKKMQDDVLLSNKNKKKKKMSNMSQMFSFLQREHFSKKTIVVHLTSRLWQRTATKATLNHISQSLAAVIFLNKYFPPVKIKKIKVMI